MDLDLASKINEHYLGSTYQTNCVNNIGKDEIDSARTFISNYIEKQVSNAVGFEETLKGKYPEMIFQQVDASKVPSGIWGRTDYPFEKFFDDNVNFDEVLNWKPNGTAPEMSSKECQSRFQSTFGKKAVLIPPALQEKMDKDPVLEKKVASTVDAFIQQSQRPPRAASVLISLSEDGEIANWTTCTEGGFMGPSEKEVRMLEERRQKRAEQEEEYRKIIEESALKHKIQLHEAERKYSQRRMSAEAVAGAYEIYHLISDADSIL